MEELLINRTTSMCNGNVRYNGYEHEAASSMTCNDEPREAPVSNTLVFYVNGNEVRQAHFSHNITYYCF